MMRNGWRLRLWRAAVRLLFAVGVCASAAQAKPLDDVVVLKNGDRLTGEIKGLQRGELRFKSGYMAEAVRLDWSQVERLESKGRFLIVLIDGQLFTDSLRLAPSSAAAAGTFLIGAEQNAVRAQQMEVLRILPVEASFWQQLEGTIDFGTSFTSATGQYQTELSASATYRRGDHTLSGRVDSVFSGQTEGSSSARNQLTFDYRKQLTPRWYVGGLLDFLRSDQQSLALRTTVGGLIGRNLMQTEHTRLSVFGGLAGTREKYSVELGRPRTTNADALAGLDFTTFRFKTTDLNSRLLFYPSLTTPGRMRMQFKTDMRIELLKDFYWGFHLYENFDSKPPVEADRNEFGVGASLGWKF